MWVLSPFEVACLDLQGRIVGRPVCDLLSGRARDRVPFSAYLFYKWAGHQCGVDVVTAPLPIVDGWVAVPAGPGLGVELDRDALSRMHEDHLRCGIRERDDTGYLRSLQPTYELRIPRW